MEQQKCTHSYYDGSKQIRCHKNSECDICKHCSSDCPGHYRIRITSNRAGNNGIKTIHNHRF